MILHGLHSADSFLYKEMTCNLRN